jgi:hypothetical protein
LHTASSTSEKVGEYLESTVAFLRQAGVEVKFLELESVGIRGNGHFMFMELNNLVVAERVEEWVGGYAGVV